MKITRCFMFALFTFAMFTFVANGFAQNTAPEHLVRLVYFVPSDRTAKPNIDTIWDKRIRKAQSFFADMMETHGFSRKTFQFETNAQGNAVVHRVNGKSRWSYYSKDPARVADELGHLNIKKNTYVVAVDAADDCFENGVCGIAMIHHERTAIVPFFESIFAVEHELGHIFGLRHDYRDVSYFGFDPMLASFCAHEWLDASRYLNTNLPPSTAPTTVQMLPPLAAPPYAVRFRFETRDTDGLHQAQLIADGQGWEKNNPSLIACKSLNGKNNAPVEFVTTKLSGGPTTAADGLWLQVIDKRGNMTVQYFGINIRSLLPPPKVVSIRDANLAAAIRKQLGIPSGSAITDLDMLSLRTHLTADGPAKITDLTGLEYATNLWRLELSNNKISDVSPLAGLTQLTELDIRNNQISDLTPLAGLTQLTWLSLANNQIDDVSPLAGLTQLTELDIRNNQISDLTPLAGLTQLTWLSLANNQIDDVSPLAGLTQLTELDIRNNQISDLTPLAGLVNLEEFDISGNPFTTIPNRASIVFGLHSDKALLIKKHQFVVYGSGNLNSNLTSSAPVTVKDRHFYNLLHNDNLTGFFADGGTIELVTYNHNLNFGDVVISEIMWGSNEGSPYNQWIELYNTTANDITLEDGNAAGYFWAFRFTYGPVTDNPQSHWTVMDRVSNTDWKVPGQSGNIDQKQPLVSMYRTIDYKTGKVPDGTLASSWRASTGRVNLQPPSYGTPGAKHTAPSPVALIPAPQRLPMYWIDTKVGTLYRLIGDKVENFLPNVRNATSLTVDWEKSKLYWTEKTGNNTGRIRRANLDGTDLQLVKDLTSLPLDIALDTEDGKLYLANAYGKIQKLNVEGSNFQPNFITGLESPTDIALDVKNGKVYWIENADRIRRANLDGTPEVETLATGLDRPMSLVATADKLYWAEQIDEKTGRIQRADLDGENVETIITLPRILRGIAIETKANTLYWTDTLGSIQWVDIEGNRNIQNVAIEVGTPGALVLRDSALIGPIVIAQAPPMYWVNKETGTLHRLVDSKVGNFLPSIQNATKIAIDQENKKVYWVEEIGENTSRIRRANLDGTNAQLVKDLKIRIRDMIVHTKTGTLYLASGGGKIQSIKVDGSQFRRDLITGLKNAKSLTLDSVDNNIYWVEHGEKQTSRIRRATLDASNIQTFLTGLPKLYSLRDITLAAGKLYWAESTGGGSRIQCVNVNGQSEIQTLSTLERQQVQSIAIDTVRHRLYWTTFQGKIQRSTLKGMNIVDIVTDLKKPDSLALEVMPKSTATAAPALSMAVPEVTILYPNYPNPFNPETWIPYQLAKPADVTLTIYDVQGRVVRALDLGHQRAGLYQNRSRAAYWDGRNEYGEPVASGLYFYTLTTGDFSATRKMLIRK